jgi:hypothetical protein
MTIPIGLSAASDGLVQMVLSDFPAQGIAVNSENLGGAALVPAGMLQDSPDKLFLELRQGFLEQNTALDHHSDQRLQLLFHVCMLRSEAPGESPRA